MRMRRTLRGLMTGAALGLGLTAPALADGLAQFDKLIKPQLPPGSLTYKSAKALGDNGFVLEGVVVTPPPDTPGGKAEPISIKRLAVEDFDFAAFEKQAPPNFAKVRIEGLAVSGKPAEGIDLKQLAGIDKVNADFQLDYRLEPDRKTLTLNRLEVDLSGLARLELSMILDGVDPAADQDKAMNDASLRTASLVFEDRSILAKAVPAIAQMQGGDPAVTIATAKAMIAPVRAGQGAATQAAFDALESFLDDYKQPKGPLRLTLNPPSKISAAALSGAASADDVVKALGLVVSYAGTVPQKAPAPSVASPAAIPPVPADAVAKGAKPACAAGARFFVLHEEAWWAATAREPGKSGKECIARLDGGGTDDVVVSPEQTMAWSIDGPGKAIDKCKSGDKVLVESDGGWYPAKIADKPGAGGKCTVKYDDPNSDDEAVELKRVRRLD
jgi:hypothetical protein